MAEILDYDYRDLEEVVLELDSGDSVEVNPWEMVATAIANMGIEDEDQGEAVELLIKAGNAFGVDMEDYFEDILEQSAEMEKDDEFEINDGPILIDDIIDLLLANMSDDQIIQELSGDYPSISTKDIDEARDYIDDTEESESLEGEEVDYEQVKRDIQDMQINQYSEEEIIDKIIAEYKELEPEDVEEIITNMSFEESNNRKRNRVQEAGGETAVSEELISILKSGIASGKKSQINFYKNDYLAADYELIKNQESLFIKITVHLRGYSFPQSVDIEINNDGTFQEGWDTYLTYYINRLVRENSDDDTEDFDDDEEDDIFAKMEQFKGSELTSEEENLARVIEGWYNNEDSSATEYAYSEFIDDVYDMVAVADDEKAKKAAERFFGWNNEDEEFEESTAVRKNYLESIS